MLDTTREIIDIALTLSSIVGAAAAVTYWGGRISRSVETVADQITGLRRDIQTHSETLTRHADRLHSHAERISVIETRQGG